VAAVAVAAAADTVMTEEATGANKPREAVAAEAVAAGAVAVNPRAN
jgi:hypothetical protein